MKKAKRRATAPPADVKRRPDRDRRIRQSDRIARVLGVLNLIQSRGRWNARAISAELECSERTVYRDLEVLEFAGVPWFFDEDDKCYRVRPDYRFPTLRLNDEEVFGQGVATAITSAPGLNIGLGARPTTRRLAAASKEDVQQILADAAQLVEVFDLKMADHSKHGEVIKSVQFALLKSNQIIGTYDSPYEDGDLRLTIHPYRLCLVKQAWYIAGHIDGEQEAKTFRVARFKTLRALDQPASIPDGFNLREYFGNAWAVYRGEKAYRVVLRFEKSAAKVVTETVWHHTQQIDHHKDGRVSLSFTIDGLEEILHWILGWSPSVKVIEPDELKVRLLQALEEALQLNSQA